MAVVFAHLARARNFDSDSLGIAASCTMTSARRMNTVSPVKEEPTLRWAELECRVGPATEVPRHLTALADGTKAEAAQVALLTLLVHREHHVVFTGTEAAVPRILEIASDPGSSPLSVEAALTLLRDFATFRGSEYLVAGVPTREGDVDSANSFVRVPALIAKRAEVFEALLGHTEERVRSAAALLAALFPRASTLEALTAQRRREHSPRTRASLLIAEGLTARLQHAPAPADLPTWLGAPDVVERTAAAIALALGPGTLSDEAFDVLEDAEELEFLRDYSFWNEGRLDAYAKRVYAL